MGLDDGFTDKLESFSKHDPKPNAISGKTVSDFNKLRFNFSEQRIFVYFHMRLLGTQKLVYVNYLYF